MAIAGKKPKPGALRFIEGNREHRPIKEGYKPAPIMPKMSRWLSPVAKTEWKRAGPILFKSGLLTREDRAAFEAYCENYAIYFQCRNYITHRGGYAEYIAWCMRSDQMPRHVNAMKDAVQQIRLFCAEFGLTPSARMRIEIRGEEPEDNDDLD
jgi:P27 family predicted phage terminase small subunit